MVLITMIPKVVLRQAGIQEGNFIYQETGIGTQDCKMQEY